MAQHSDNTETENREPGLEEQFTAIEEILNEMEQPEVTLDRSFELYKKGIARIQAAAKCLDTIEKEMLVLNETGELEEF